MSLSNLPSFFFFFFLMVKHSSPTESALELLHTQNYSIFTAAKSSFSSPLSKTGNSGSFGYL